MAKEVVKGNWSSESAFNLPLALQESRQWIEAVVGQKFASDDFQLSLKNGILLCHLINQIKPKSVLKISNGRTDFDQRGNLVDFIKACKQVGLRDAQLFDPNDLFEAQRLRNVAICLYWLGRAARCIPTYKGPHLNLQVFKKMHCTACKKHIEGNNYLATLNQQYHIGCARCSECKCALDPKQPFYQSGDKIFCPNCMVSASSVSSNLAGPGGKKSPHSHSHGDNCGGCFRDMEGQSHVVDKDKKFCLDCICDQCHEPLLGNFSVKNGKKYCDGCRCFDCDTPLTNGFYEEGNLRFCDNCNHKHEEDLKKPHKHTHDRSEENLGMGKKPPLTHGHSNQDLKGKPHSHSHGHPHSHSHDHSEHDLKGSGGIPKKECGACGKSTAGKPHKPGDRDKFCPPHENDYCCAHCDLELSGPVKDDGKGKRYHPDCYQKINKASHSPCAGCSKSIEVKPVEALDKKWHPECFNCTGCKSAIPNGKFVEGEDGKPYCMNCGDGETTNLSWGPKDKCGGCDKPLAGMVTHVMGHFWHQGCFKCYRCNVQKFVSGYFPFNEKPYCEPCHAILTKAERCSKCEEVLVGECIKTESATYHKKCFACTLCSKGLTKEDGQTKFGKPYCKQCAPRASRTCIKCRKVMSTNDDYAEVGGKAYCKGCAPASNQHVYGDDKKTGFTIDPRSGKKTFK
jgi:hypothetical protein